MSKISRHCPRCKRTMPFDWHKPVCKFCGARVKLDVSGGAPMWDGQADLSGWGKKKFKPAKKLTGREEEAAKIVSVAEPPRTTFSSRSPFVLFAGALLTLGISSTVWIFRRLILINECVRDEECARVGGFFVWIFSHIAAICLLGAALWDYVTFSALSPDFLPGLTGGGAAAYLQASWHSWKISLMLLYFAIAFLMSRYYLFWIRDAVAEEVMKGAAKSAAELENQEDAEADDSYLFTRAPLLLWYFGVAYLQLHINRAQKRGLLTEASFLRPKPSKPEKPEEKPDDAPQ